VSLSLSRCPCCAARNGHRSLWHSKIRPRRLAHWRQSGPVAGEFAFILFGLGIVGTDLLAIPILAGSAAYAIGEACKWPIGLSRHPSKAVAFYTTLIAAAVLSVAITVSPIDPIKALNGVVAVPVMAVMMLMTAQPRIMGKFTITGWRRTRTRAGRRRTTRVSTATRTISAWTRRTS
jgi:Mn2+/Fe2+ NRAMP family transporter